MRWLCIKYTKETSLLYWKLIIVTMILLKIVDLCKQKSNIYKKVDNIRIGIKKNIGYDKINRSLEIQRNIGGEQ